MTGSDPKHANDRSSATRALLQGAKLIPVLTITDLKSAVPLAKALVAGGVRTLEITLRTSAGADAASAILDEVPEAIVGLGTVLTAADLALCKKRGFHFAFSPGASPALLDAAVTAGIDFVPGIQTASEIMACLERGFDTMKFFPAVPAGGLAAVKALAGPFPNISFCPTGGISEADTAAWLKLPNVLAVGGSWLAPPDEVARGDWAAITARASRALAALS